MSTTYSRDRINDVVSIDTHALVLAILLVGVSLAAASIVPWLIGPDVGMSQPAAVEESSAAEQGAAGGVWAIAETIFAVFMLGVILAFRRLPAVLQRVLKRAARYAIVLGIGGVLYSLGGEFWITVGVVIGLYVVLQLIDYVGAWWVINDVGVLFIAIAGAAVCGILFNVWFVLIGMIGLSIYDHFFANKQTWMLQLAGPLVKYRLPVLFIVPFVARFQWDDLLGEFDDEDDEDFCWGIGTADLLLPGMFVAALVAYWSGPVVAGMPLAAWGAVAGLVVAASRISYEMDTRGSGAGMPPITAGAIGGFVVFAALGVVIG